MRLHKIFQHGNVFTPEMSAAAGGQQYVQFDGLASDDVARMELFYARGERVRVPLVDNVFLVKAARSKFPARLVAYDKRTGKEAASADLPSGAIGTPMTYAVGGKQYIAVTVGGDVPELIALAVP